MIQTFVMKFKIIGIPGLLLFSILFCFQNESFGQLPLKPYDSIVLKVSGTALKNPWGGGFNSPQFSSIDLNNDGKADLVSFERSFFGVFKTFLQRGEEGESTYEYATKYQYFFPKAQNWALLVDYNCDGH